MKTIEITDAKVIESVRNALPEATITDKGLLSSLYRDRIEPKRILIPETQKIYRIERCNLGRVKVSLISAGAVYKGPSAYIVSMGLHETTSNTDIVPQVVKLIGDFMPKFLYKVAPSKEYVDLYLKTTTTFYSICVSNLHESTVSKPVKFELYEGDEADLISLGTI